MRVRVEVRVTMGVRVTIRVSEGDGEHHTLILALGPTIAFTHTCIHG